MRLDVRNIIRFTLVVITVIYLLDAGVEASKNRKKRHRHRSKRTHGDRPAHRHKNHGKSHIAVKVTETSNGQSAILVEKQKKYRHQQAIPRNEGGLDEFGFPSHVYEQVLKEKREHSKHQQQNEEDTTVMPVVKAKLEFFIKRKLTEDFYPPPTTTTTTINGFSSSELGLLPFHTTHGKYGLHTSAENIFGKVIHVTDAGRTNSHFACGEAIANLHEIPKNNESWIALIERGHCSFFRKIKLAQKNNASAVIFYDNKDEDIPKINTIGTRIVSVIMGKDDGHHVAKVIGGNAMVMAHIAVRTDPTPDPSMISSASLFSNLQMLQESTPHGGAMTYHRNSIMTAILSTLIVVIYYRAVIS